MKEIHGEELKQIQLNILDVVTSFCEEHRISYWLDSGTLLGAIRHKGYIPWDDDIDLGMLRGDYDRFMALFNQHNQRYQFFSIENNKKFYYAHGKVLDTQTVLYEPDEKGNKLSINIDIFVYDEVPNDPRELKRMYDRRDWLRMLHQQRTFNYSPRGNAIRRSAVYFFRCCLKIVPRNFFIEKLLMNSKKHCGKNLDHVGNFTAYTRMVCHKRVFCSFIEAEFEGKLYKIPAGYDEWLRAFYGDYMELPPVEKRVSHHTFKAYIIEED